MLIRLLTTTAMVLALTAPAVAYSLDYERWSKPDPRELQIAQNTEQDTGVVETLEEPSEVTAEDGVDPEAAADEAAHEAEVLLEGDAVQEEVEIPAETTVIAEQDSGQWRADTLVGMYVTNPAGEAVGDVADLLISQDGRVEGVVLSVGGFLGIGAKYVALGWDEVQILEDQDVVVVDQTRDQLEAAPDFRTKEQIAEQMEIERMRQQPQEPLGSQTVPIVPEEPGAEEN